MKNSAEFLGGREKSPRGVVNHVKVSFTAKEWNLAKEGMNKLLNERDNISKSIFKTISDINKNVFSREIVFVDDDQEKEEKKYLSVSTKSDHLFEEVKVMFCVANSNFFFTDRL